MAGTWQGLVHQPTFHPSTMILLTDGRIMVQEEATPHWHALTPDSHGSYVNGTWSTLKDMSFWRRYYASAVLKDGRVIVIGGEQSGAGGDTNRGEVYDPVADSWSPIPSPPGWTTVGDAPCCVLPDGRLMIGALWPSTQCTIYNPVTNSWSPAASKATSPNEETWILLPDDTILTVQCWAPYQTEKYIIASNTWKNEGALPVPIVDPVMHEIGPGMLTYDGKVIFFGAANSGGHGKTVVYSPSATPAGTGTWTAGPDIPQLGGQTMVCNDCPGTLMPNGNVLIASAKFMNNDWGSPILFFEYDPTAHSISMAPTPPNNGEQLYWSRFMLTPSGQVLFSARADDIQCYTPSGGPHDAWRPTISAVVPLGAGNYLLKGTRLNGLSQANIYGDDCYCATNFPLVRLRDSLSGQVYYCRTYDFSTMGVATGSSLQSVRFVAPHVPHGNYDLCVVANGISSHCVDLSHRRRSKPCGCEDGRERECCCRERCQHESACHGEKDSRVEPEIRELRDEIKRLQNAVHRLASSAKKEPEREVKEVTRGDDDQEARERRGNERERREGKAERQRK